MTKMKIALISLGSAAVVTAGLAYEIVTTQPVREAMRTCSELFTIANRPGLTEAARLEAARAPDDPEILIAAEGETIELRAPAPATPPAPVAAAAAPAESALATGSVLLVFDDAKRHDRLAGVLQTEHVGALTASFDDAAVVAAREQPAVVLTTVNAILQRVPPREVIARQSLSAAPGNLLPMAGVTQWLELNGFNRAATVREPGDYAVRGGILDLFAPGMAAPVRLDFFGDTLETIRSFDPETQRTTEDLRALDLVPMAEFQLTTDTIRLFRTGYVAAFGAAAPDDVL